MANPQRPGPSSVFDDLLVQGRKGLDALSRGGPATAAPIVRPDPDSPVTRLLNERFGNDWRYEVTERRRDGDEAIVLCKLFLGKEGALRSQFGRAKISEGPIAGAVGGVRFKIVSAGAEQGERDAFRRATEAALMYCADLA
jgi:hypothetical protein